MRIPASIESQARMTPSRVQPPREKTEKVMCGCCNRLRTAGGTHPILGQLCLWCTRAFDTRVDHHGIKLHPQDSCPLCAEGVCTIHE